MNHLYIFILFIILSAVSCNSTNDTTYFNGEIRQINDKVRKETNVVLTPVSLDGNNYGFFSVYDSLIFFMNPKLPDRFFNVFNVDTGEEIGTFHDKGQGPNEFTGLSPIFQFDKVDGELKTLLYAPLQNKLVDWNITKTLQQCKLVIDSIIQYTWREEKPRRYLSIYITFE